MSSASFQLYRAKFLIWYDSTIIVAIRFLFLFVGLAAICLLVLALVLPLSQGVMAVALVMLGPSLLLGSFHLYVRFLKENPAFLLTTSLRRYLVNNCDFETALLIEKINRSQTQSELWRSLFESGQLSVILYRLGLTPAKLISISGPFDQAVKDSLMSDLNSRIQGNPAKLLTIVDLLGVLIELDPLKKVLASFNLEPTEAATLLSFYEEKSQLAKEYQQGIFGGERVRTGGFAKAWSVAYTNVLDIFTQEIDVAAARSLAFSPLYSRRDYALQIVRELNKSSSQNVLLIGPAGVGKKEVFHHFAALVLLYRTDTPLDGSQIRLLDVQRLLSRTASPGELEVVFSQIFADLDRAGNVILFVENIELLLDPNGQAGTANAGALLDSYLQHDKIHVVATVLMEDYLKLIKPNRALATRFTAVEVPEPSGDELLKILLFHLPRFESRYQVFFSLAALKALIKLAARYVKDRASPRRELDLIEEVAAEAQSQHRFLVTTDEVTAVVERRAKVPIRVDREEQKTLMNLEEALHRRIVGQNRAIKQVSDALLRSRTGLTTADKPVGSFLFLGPTGVGKTETAKALAQIYYGGVERMVRLDMTEFADSYGLAKLLGTDPVNQPGALTLLIQQNPSTVVLFDEIEKSSEQVRNLFLQLLDEGRLTTNYGKVLDFTNSIVIATSNAGSQYIKQMVERGVAVEQFEKQLLDKLIEERVFLPEFLNRFDGVVVYLPLSPVEVEEIVRLQIAGLIERVKREKGIELKISESVVRELASQGYDPVFGARALSRIIKERLETQIARQLLGSASGPGSQLSIESIT